jgi:signal transduction histidine kinase
MNEVSSKLPVPRQEVSLARGDLRGGEIAGVTPAALDEILHDLRQPLGVIEALAYYLELTASEEKVRVHLQRIQAMVAQANRILERTSACRKDFAPLANCPV